MAARTSKGLLFVLLASLGAIIEIPFRFGAASLSSGNNSGSNPSGNFSSQTPQSVGADAVPDLTLPHTLSSSIDNLIGAGGVEYASPDNITLHNLGIRMRLLGGAYPHDQLLSSGHTILSSLSFWAVQAKVNNIWIPLIPISNSFTVLGTNVTGTFIVRKMQVTSGPQSGVLTVAYRALSNGSLKWDLQFSSNTSGNYRFAFEWLNITSSNSIDISARKFYERYSTGNYTLSWADLPATFNATASLRPDSLLLTIPLGTMAAGSFIALDPSIAGNVSANASAYTFQRKVYYEPQGGYYFVFIQMERMQFTDIPTTELDGRALKV